MKFINILLLGIILLGSSLQKVFAEEEGWFARNWKWLVPVVAIGAAGAYVITKNNKDDDNGGSSKGSGGGNKYSGTIKLMPIGDSITHGSLRTGDVRCKLWNKLKTTNRSFDFVGSMYGYRDQTADPDCDKNHEAHSGWRADQILSIIGGSASKYKPDIAVIHLGTNDITAKQSNASTVNEIDQIIDRLRAQNPKIVVFVGIIPNYRSTHRVLTQDLNARLSQMANAKSTSSNPVIYVDQSVGFESSDVPDGCHPNNAGAEKMATKWAEAITNYLND